MKSFHFEAYTISETARKLGYKSTKTIYQLLNRDLLEDYVYLENSGRVYLILEPQNIPTLAKKLGKMHNLNIDFLNFLLNFLCICTLFWHLLNDKRNISRIFLKKFV